MVFDINNFRYGRDMEEIEIGDKLLPTGKVRSAVAVFFQWFYCCRWLLSGTDPMALLRKGVACVRSSFMLSGSIMWRLTLPLLMAMVFLTACSGGGGGGGGSGGGGGGDGMNNMSLDGDGMNNMSLDGDGINNMSLDGDGMNNMSLDGDGMNNMSPDGDGLPVSGGVKLSISPFVGGLRIQWHNLPAVEQAGGISIYLSLTNNTNSSQPIEREIVIGNLTDDSYNFTGLNNGIAYRLVEVRVELPGNISQVIDNIEWSEPWEPKTNAQDQENDGIVVGANYDGDGRADDVDEDDDNDGVNNTRAGGMIIWDLCRQGALNWRSNSTSDHDGDGCRDRDEDWDNDNDGVNNTRTDRMTIWDLCRQGELNWLSNSTSDYDDDGCRDEGAANGGYGEDEDDDNDRRPDAMDNCRLGAIGWSSTDSMLDHDSDGCRDRDEDTDDDNDRRPDTMDTCRLGAIGWSSTDSTLDYDSDGCRDRDEDWDNDNDGVNNTRAGGAIWDRCRQGELNWRSNSTSDHDGDGCRDEGAANGGYGEDEDDDNDDRPDAMDTCRLGAIDWLSTDSMLDHDSDGCRDRDEDWDNDNDGVNNTRADSTEWDLCPQGELNWLSNNTSDYDGDGCRDEGAANGGYGEDTDDDNDRRPDAMDTCRLGAIGWSSTDSTLDYDRDGCRNDEDTDGDNDGVNNTNEEAGCELNEDCDNDRVLDGDEPTGCVQSRDCDSDTVLDGDEADTSCITNPNCDNDELGDSQDSCPAGQRNWNNDGTNDVDSDGCRNDEDLDDDGNRLIEIGTAAELDAVRWVLDGTGFKANETAILDKTGCGGSTTIVDCSGYELIGNISLSGYINRMYGTAGWQPIASDTAVSTNQCSGDRFTATFDGNGFVISGLLIDRSDENCVGLFGQVQGATIRHLGVVADKIKGRRRVGGLVGLSGIGTSIVHSYVVSDEVSGTGDLGGLVGSGTSASIVHSYAVSDSVSGTSSLGGLVGSGDHASIVQSYAVSNSVSGISSLGGLVGDGDHASIVQSYAVSDSVSGMNRFIGGLVGSGVSASIVQSYAVSNSVSGGNGDFDGHVGGLVGWGHAASIVHSYAVSNSVSGARFIGGLVGDGSKTLSPRLPGDDGSASVSYWDTDTSGETNDNATGSSGQTSMALRSPTGYTGIYATWDDGAINERTTIAGVGRDGTIWCDEDISGVIEDDERRDNTHANGDNRVWDFGGTTDYPAIRCTGDSLADQRAWWHLDATDKPELNQTRLDDYLDGTLP